MPLVKQLIRFGNSRGVILPKPYLDQLALPNDNAELEIALEGDRIVLTAHRYATDDEFKVSAERVMSKRRGLMKRLSKR